VTITDTDCLTTVDTVTVTDVSTFTDCTEIVSTETVTDCTTTVDTETVTETSTFTDCITTVDTETVTDISTFTDCTEIIATETVTTTVVTTEECYLGEGGVSNFGTIQCEGPNVIVGATEIPEFCDLQQEQSLLTGSTLLQLHYSGASVLMDFSFGTSMIAK
jgi:hypothetical protein